MTAAVGKQLKLVVNMLLGAGIIIVGGRMSGVRDMNWAMPMHGRESRSVVFVVCCHMNCGLSSHSSGDTSLRLRSMVGGVPACEEDSEEFSSSFRSSMFMSPSSWSKNVLSCHSSLYSSDRDSY